MTKRTAPDKKQPPSTVPNKAPPGNFSRSGKLETVLNELFDETAREYGVEELVTTGALKPIVGTEYTDHYGRAYRNEDLKDVAVAMDMRNSGYLLNHDESDLTEYMAKRVDYYKQFETKLGDSIRQNFAFDINGNELNVGDLLVEYGRYRLEQIDVKNSRDVRKETEKPASRQSR